MKPTLPSFLTVFFLAAMPALWVYLTFPGLYAVALVAGTTAVAGLTSGALAMARSGGWKLHLVVLGAAVTAMPFVAGVTSGFVEGVCEWGPGSVMSGLDTGLFGALILFPGLALAEIVVWFMGWAAEVLMSRRHGREAVPT